MNNPHLRTLDLNLLRVFLALLDEGSVTRAGIRLGLTQSAVSHALNRLRYFLGDELFVRGPAGMQPTARATEIAPRVRQGLGDLTAALAPATFLPAETDRRFVIASGSYSASVLLPEVIARVRREAPRASVRVHAPYGALEELDAGRSDVVIGAFLRTPERFDCERLFSDRLVWIVRQDHPLAHGRLTLEALADLPHLIVTASDAPDPTQTSVIEHGIERRTVMEDGILVDELAARGLTRSVPLVVPDMHAALAIVAQSDMTAAVPRGLAKVFGEALRLKVLEPPYVSGPTDVVALWRKDNDGPALQWLRSLLREAGSRFMDSIDGE